MNTITNSDGYENLPGEPEFSPQFIRWLIIITVGTLFLVAFFSPHLLGGFKILKLDIRHSPEYLFNFVPWVVVGGYTVEQGICGFSGTDYILHTKTEHYFLLSALIFMSIIGPTLFFLGWRASSKRQHSRIDSHQKLYASTLAFVIGGVIIAPTVISSVPAAYMTRNVYTQMLNSAAVQEDIDLLIAELSKLSFNIAEYYALSPSHNGNKNSFKGYSIQSSSPWGSENKAATFQIVSVTDSMVIMKAISKKFPDSSILGTIDSSLSFKYFDFTGKFN